MQIKFWCKHGHYIFAESILQCTTPNLCVVLEFEVVTNSNIYAFGRQFKHTFYIHFYHILYKFPAGIGLMTSAVTAMLYYWIYRNAKYSTA